MKEESEKQTTLDTRHRTMTNKTEVTTQKTKTIRIQNQTTLETRHREDKPEVTTQKTKTMKLESRDTENTRHKTPNKDKQNRSYNTEN